MASFIEFAVLLSLKSRHRKKAVHKNARCQVNAASQTKEKNSEGFATYIYKIDIASLFIFACMFIIFNAIYWHNFLKSSSEAATKSDDTVDAEANASTMNGTDETTV